MNIGIDIGGTKCAVVSGNEKGIARKIRFATTSYQETMEQIFSAVERIGAGEAIGVSCGGPLDSRLGLILSPPNLVGWDRVPIVELLRERFGVPAYLCNDANACALAEWKYGAGKGTKNMIFLTFGTGMGAGLILNGALYEGANGMAGEVGHIRLCEYGPVGYGKMGSFEGFCSGGGLAQLGKMLAIEEQQKGNAPIYAPTVTDLDRVTAKSLAEAATRGDPTAKKAFRVCGEMLGRGLAVLADLFDPEAIVIGSVFQRAEALLREPMEQTFSAEAHPYIRKNCRVVPAALGDAIGDYAALSVYYINRKENE